MISLAGFTRLNVANGELQAAILLSIDESRQLVVDYISRTGRKSRRTITPKGLYQNRLGNHYLVAFCEKAGEDRMFSLGGIKIIERLSVKNSKEKDTFIRHRVVKDPSGRPVCATAGCNNLAEIHHSTSEGKKYRSTCSSCRKRPKNKSVLNYTATAANSVNSGRGEQRMFFGRPVCETERCRNLVAVHRVVEDRTEYYTMCADCLANSTEKRMWAPNQAGVSKKVQGDRLDQHNDIDVFDGEINMTSDEKQRGLESQTAPSAAPIVSDYDLGFMTHTVDQLRRKLLDLSRRNNLINFKQSDRNKRVVRVVDELPEILLSSLIDGKMSMKPLPDVGEEPADEKTDEFNIALSSALTLDEDYLDATKDLEGTAEDQQLAELALGVLKDKVRKTLGLPKIVRDGPPVDIRAHARAHGFDPNFELPKMATSQEHQDNQIQTLLMPDELQRRLKNIYSNYRLIQNDKGLNTFYACFGFLKWFEHSNSDQENISPLVLLPVEITKKPTRFGHSYSFTANGAEPIINQTLAEKLKSDLGVDLPEYVQDDLAEEAAPQLESYFEKLEEIVSKKPKWTVQRQVSFGFFNYLDIVIFNDLLPQNWPSTDTLLGHEIVARLLNGIPSSDVGDLSDERDIDRLTISNKIPHLVLPADSSQHSAIIHALEGKPLVIQGPPGTGKSQTITNLIAALASEGKRVLFLAEKQPALDVVKDRLASVGLGDVVFDPRVSGDKAEIYAGLERRLELRPSYNKEKARTDIDKLRNTIAKTAEYRDVINFVTDYCSKPLFELIWLAEGARDALAQYELPYLIDGALTKLDDGDLAALNELIEQFLPILELPIDDSVSLEGFSKFPTNPVQMSALQQRAKLVASAFSDLLTSIDELPDLKSLALMCDISGLLQDLKFYSDELDDESIGFLLEKPDASALIEQALVASKKIKNLEAEFPFLAALKEGGNESLLKAAAEVDDFVSTEPALASLSQNDLENLIASEKINHQLMVSLLSRVDAESKLVCSICFKDLRVLGQEVFGYEADWLNRIECLDRLIPERLSDDLASELETLFSQTVTLENKINSLPRSIDFEKLLDEYTADEIVDLRHRFGSIGLVGGLFSASAKQTKQKISALGFDVANKETTSRNLEQLATCLKEALILSNSPVIGLCFHDPELNFLGKSTVLRDTIRAIHTLVGLSTKASITTDVASTLNVVRFIVKHSETCGSVLESISDEHENMRLSDYSRFSENKSEVIADVLQACELIGFPRDIQINAVFENTYVETFVGFENDKKSSTIEALKVSSIDGFQRMLTASSRIDLTLTNYSFLDNKTLRGLLAPRNILLVKNLRNELDAVISKIQEFGTEFFHKDYANFEISEDRISPGAHQAFFNSIASAKTQSLLDAGLHLAVFSEIKKSADPEFFDLIKQIKTNYEKFSIEDAKTLFTLRTSQAILRKISASNEIDLPVSVAQSLGDVGQAFKLLDKSISKGAAQLALKKVCDNFVPKGIDYGSKSNFTELALIKNEINKKRKKSVRYLVRRATKALLALKPVWFLNPIAASQFLPRENSLFDVVIIDEASQMLPERAIAGIARSNNLVVVGDNKQMPPTNWLKSSLEFDEEEEEEVDAESILDLAQQRVGNSVSLRWHYRSRHPDLIRFSNTKFYDDKLEIFPTPSGEKSKLGVKCVKVDGIYQGQQNSIEVKEVLIQARELMERYPDESMGIVAINRPQMERIREAIENSTDEIIREYLQRWDGDVLNELFVKNLDNVQGDERDNIIISTVYGPEKLGSKVMQRFSSVVSMNGHRRLNVLVTRAKNRIVLVTSLLPKDISVSESSPPGKKIFRDYIEYAMTGKLETGELLKREADSDFEVAVGRMIESAGYEVTPQVGVKGFRIDLGVTHPEYPYGFIAGVECDGAAFHSSSSARDRDAIRQDILESLGWKIYRVWSTDWFADPQKERAKFFKWLGSIWTPPSTATEKADKAVSDSTDKQDEPNGVLVGPSGQRGVIDIEDEKIEYWKPIDGLYELWIDGSLIGFTEEEEIEAVDANSGFASRMAARHVVYHSELLLPAKKTESHDRFEIGLRWLYTLYKKEKLNS